MHDDDANDPLFSFTFTPAHNDASDPRLSFTYTPAHSAASLGRGPLLAGFASTAGGHGRSNAFASGALAQRRYARCADDRMPPFLTQHGTESLAYPVLHALPPRASGSPLAPTAPAQGRRAQSLCRGAR